jgi:hypothetical protein
MEILDAALFFSGDSGWMAFNSEGFSNREKIILA